MWTEVRSSIGRSRTGRVDAHARPEPPRSLHTGRGALVKVTAFMGFSFAMKGNAEPGWGTWGSPFGKLREAERFFARQAVRRVEGPHPSRAQAFSRCRAAVAARQAIDVSSVAEGALGQRADQTRTSRIDGGQVTTATPAGLDFRAAEATDEGLQTRCLRKACSVWASWSIDAIDATIATWNRRQVRADVTGARVSAYAPPSDLRAERKKSPHRHRTVGT